MDNDNKSPQNKSRLPYVALWLDIGAVISFFLGLGCFYTVVLIYFALFFFLCTVILPFVAIVLGISALCLGKNKIGIRGKIVSLVAILAPIIFIVVMIILFSTGVAVIRWM